MIVNIDHVQISIPRQAESQARKFYGEILGLPEVVKPPSQTNREGVWFEQGSTRVHLGVDPDFRPASRSHTAFSVADLESLRKRLIECGYVLEDGTVFNGRKRFFCRDPFGNRLEFLEHKQA